MENKNIEFVSANELPVTEATEVDVLCVENGELKRKSGASLGGSDSAYCILIDSDYNLLSVPDGLYDVLVDLFDNHKGFVLQVYMLCKDGSDDYLLDWRNDSSSMIKYYREEEMFNISCNNSAYVSISKDGNHGVYFD